MIVVFNGLPALLQPAGLSQFGGGVVPPPPPPRGLSISPTQSEIQQAVGNFLAAALPGIDVVVGQANRAAEPASPTFVVFTPIFFRRLATNVDSWDGVATATLMQEAEVTVQLDFHSADPLSSSDVTETVATLFRDEYAVTQFAGQVPDFGVVPLYAGEPRQIPFLNAENQYETRWVLELMMQVDQTVAVPQTFADSAAVVLVEVP